MKIIPQSLINEGAESGMTPRQVEEFLAPFSFDTLVRSKEVCFMMFLPDAIAQNTVKDILRDYKIVPLLYKLLSVEPQKAENIYETDLLSGHLYAWWIKRKIFELNNVLVAIVKCTDVPKQFKDIYSFLRHVKGKSNPALAKKGTIREKYRVPSKAFGYVHSSDDNLSALREALVFFSHEEIEYALKDNGEIVNEYSMLNLDFRLNKTAASDLNFPYLLYKIKNVLVKTYGEIFFETERMRLYKIYNLAFSIINKKLTFNDEKKEIDALLQEEMEVLKQVLNYKKCMQILFSPKFKEKHIQAVSLFLKLADKSNFRTVDFNLLLMQIDYVGIHLDEYDKLLLTSSMFFTDDKL